MFTKTNGKAPATTAASQPPARKSSGRPAIPSIVSEGVHVSGNLVSDGDLQIDGTVDGDITGRNVTIGATGLVTGRITAEDLNVDGTVVGEIRSSRISLSTTASIEGDITHDVLVVAAGARFEGRCRRTESVVKEPAAEAATEAGTLTATEPDPVSGIVATAPETEAKSETKQVFEQLSTAVAGRRAQGVRPAAVAAKPAERTAEPET